MADAIARSMEPLDPYDVLDYGLDLRPSLINGEIVTSASWGLEDEAVLEGMQIFTQQIVSGNQLIVWLNIAPALRSAARWAGEGRTYEVFCTFQTNSFPSRVRRRSIRINVKRR